MNVDGGTGLSMSGRDKEGLWLDPLALDEVESCLADIALIKDDPIVNYVVNAPQPVSIELFKDVESLSMEATLISVGGGGMASPLRRHPAGTILLYKALMGSSALRSVVVQQPHMTLRELKRELLSDGDAGAKVEPPLIRRLGGLSRLIESTGRSPVAVLEMAFYPPTRSDEGLSDLSPWEYSEEPSKGGGVTGLLQLHISQSAVENLFQSRSAAAAAAAAVAALVDSASLTEQKSTSMSPTAALTADLGLQIGGLSVEIAALIRRVLSSRLVGRATLSALGVQHVRGVLLYGPPGIGKTLTARELAKRLGAQDTTQVVNGPELFDKYVGVAEQRVRELFQAADDEWELVGEMSRLHVIILDELDAVAKTRTGGSGDGSSTRDSVVNQLLSKLDGVAERNNVLVVGLTNRKELIDPALLRPGRLEVHVKLRLPDLTGREEILLIALRNMTSSGLLAPDCMPEEIVPWLAEQTEGFSGAEIAGLVRSAASFSINRAFDSALPLFKGSNSVPSFTDSISISADKQLEVEVCKADFRHALAEALASAVKRNGEEERQVQQVEKAIAT